MTGPDPLIVVPAAHRTPRRQGAVMVLALVGVVAALVARVLLLGFWVALVAKVLFDASWVSWLSWTGVGVWAVVMVVGGWALRRATKALFAAVHRLEQ